MYDPQWNEKTQRYEHGDSYFDRDTQTWKLLAPPRKQGKPKGLIAAGVGIVAVVVGLAVFGPDADVDKELSVADTATTSTYRPAPVAQAPYTAPAPTTLEVEYQSMADIFIPFVRSEGVSEPESTIEIIAQAACITLRDVSYPGNPDQESVMQGMYRGTIENYPTITRSDFTTIVAAGILVYCSEFEF